MVAQTDDDGAEPRIFRQPKVGAIKVDDRSTGPAELGRERLGLCRVTPDDRERQIGMAPAKRRGRSRAEAARTAQEKHRPLSHAPPPGDRKSTRLNSSH